MGKLGEMQARRALRRVLEGRLRRREGLDPGRFTRTDLARVARRTTERYEEIARGTRLPRGWGARRNVLAGIWSLALFRSLIEEVGDREYATELAADILWIGYEHSSAIYRTVARLVARDAGRRLHLFVRLGLLYPFGRPGYEWTARVVGRTLETDFRRCPVWDFFRAQDEEARTFFRRTWCTLDFPLAEALVEGGRYERRHTLSAGDEVCDMRWVGPV